MKAFTKIFGTIFLTFITMMLIVWLVRLLNNKSAFIGISAMYQYFQTIDLLAPFNEMISSFESQINGFQNSISAFSQITDWGSFWNAIGNFMPSLWNLLSMPIQVIYYIGKFIVTLLVEITRFFTYIINY